MLDVGCGSGQFANTLRRACPDAAVIGIEYEKEVADRAKENLDKVYCGDALEIMGGLKQSGQNFSLICFNDVLEHMVMPDKALELARYILAENGSILISVPNVRYIGNLYHLVLEKNWKYEDSGIRDKTHLRFYTYKSVSSFVKELGFGIQHIAGANPTKSRAFWLLAVLTLGWLADCKYQNIVLRIAPTDHSAKSPKS